MKHLSFFAASVLWISVAHSAPAARFSGATISDKKIVATVQSGGSGKSVTLPHVARYADQYVIAEGGKAIVYQSPGSAKGGYENESDAVGRYLTSGKYSVLLNEPLKLSSIRATTTKRGRTAYVITMADGGAGIARVFVCSTHSKVWEKGSVRVAGFRNGKVILNRYPKGEEGVEAAPIGQLYLDLDTLLDAGR